MKGSLSLGAAPPSSKTNVHMTTTSFSSFGHSRSTVTTPSALHQHHHGFAKKIPKIEQTLAHRESADYNIQLDAAMRLNTPESLSFAWKLVHWMLTAKDKAGTNKGVEDAPTSSDDEKLYGVHLSGENSVVFDAKPAEAGGADQQQQGGEDVAGTGNIKNDPPTTSKPLLPDALIISLLVKKTALCGWVDLLYDATTVLRNCYLTLKPKPADLDEVVLNSVLDAYSRLSQRVLASGGDNSSMLAHMHMLFEDMKRGIKYPNLRPGAVTYGIMIKACGENGEIDRVLELWKEMETRNLKPSIVTFGCVLDALTKCGSESYMQIAASIWEAIPDKDKNCVVYSTMMKGYAKLGNLDRCDQLYRAMTKQHNVAPNIVVMNTLLSVACAKRNLPLAEKYFTAMRGYGFYPDFNSYGTLLRGYLALNTEQKEEQGPLQLEKRDIKRIFSIFRDGVQFAHLSMGSDVASLLQMIQLGMQHRLFEEVAYTLRVWQKGTCTKPIPRLAAQMVYGEICSIVGTQEGAGALFPSSSAAASRVCSGASSPVFGAVDGDPQKFLPRSFSLEETGDVTPQVNAANEKTKMRDLLRKELGILAEDMLKEVERTALRPNAAAWDRLIQEWKYTKPSFSTTAVTTGAVPSSTTLVYPTSSSTATTGVVPVPASNIVPLSEGPSPACSLVVASSAGNTAVSTPVAGILAKGGTTGGLLRTTSKANSKGLLGKLGSFGGFSGTGVGTIGSLRFGTAIGLSSIDSGTRDAPPTFAFDSYANTPMHKGSGGGGFSYGHGGGGGGPSPAESYHGTPFSAKAGSSKPSFAKGGKPVFSANGMGSWDAGSWSASSGTSQNMLGGPAYMHMLAGKKAAAKGTMRVMTPGAANSSSALPVLSKEEAVLLMTCHPLNDSCTSAASPSDGDPKNTSSCVSSNVVVSSRTQTYGTTSVSDVEGGRGVIHQVGLGGNKGATNNRRANYMVNLNKLSGPPASSSASSSSATGTGMGVDDAETQDVSSNTLYLSYQAEFPPLGATLSVPRSSSTGGQQEQGSRKDSSSLSIRAGEVILREALMQYSAENGFLPAAEELDDYGEVEGVLFEESALNLDRVLLKEGRHSRLLCDQNVARGKHHPLRDARVGNAVADADHVVDEEEEEDVDGSSTGGRDASGRETSSMMIKEKMQHKKESINFINSSSDEQFSSSKSLAALDVPEQEQLDACKDLEGVHDAAELQAKLRSAESTSSLVRQLSCCSQQQVDHQQHEAEPSTSKGDSALTGCHAEGGDFFDPKEMASPTEETTAMGSAVGSTIPEKDTFSVDRCVLPSPLGQVPNLRSWYGGERAKKHVKRPLPTPLQLEFSGTKNATHKIDTSFMLTSPPDVEIMDVEIDEVTETSKVEETSRPDEEAKKLEVDTGAEEVGTTTRAEDAGLVQQDDGLVLEQDEAKMKGESETPETFWQKITQMTLVEQANELGEDTAIGHLDVPPPALPMCLSPPRPMRNKKNIADSLRSSPAPLSERSSGLRAEAVPFVPHNTPLRPSNAVVGGTTTTVRNNTSPPPPPPPMVPDVGMLLSAARQQLMMNTLTHNPHSAFTFADGLQSTPPLAHFLGAAPGGPSDQQQAGGLYNMNMMSGSSQYLHPPGGKGSGSAGNMMQPFHQPTPSGNMLMQGQHQHAGGPSVSNSNYFQHQNHINQQQQQHLQRTPGGSSIPPPPPPASGSTNGSRGQRGSAKDSPLLPPPPPPLHVSPNLVVGPGGPGMMMNDHGGNPMQQLMREGPATGGLMPGGGHDAPHLPPLSGILTDPQNLTAYPPPPQFGHHPDPMMTDPADHVLIEPSHQYFQQGPAPPSTTSSHFQHHGVHQPTPHYHHAGNQPTPHHHGNVYPHHDTCGTAHHHHLVHLQHPRTGMHAAPPAPPLEDDGTGFALHDQMPPRISPPVSDESALWWDPELGQEFQKVGTHFFQSSEEALVRSPCSRDRSDRLNFSFAVSRKPLEIMDPSSLPIHGVDHVDQEAGHNEIAEAVMATWKARNKTYLERYAQQPDVQRLVRQVPDALELLLSRPSSVRHAGKELNVSPQLPNVQIGEIMNNYDYSPVSQEGSRERAPDAGDGDTNMNEQQLGGTTTTTTRAKNSSSSATFKREDKVIACSSFSASMEAEIQERASAFEAIESGLLWEQSYMKAWSPRFLARQQRRAERMDAQGWVTESTDCGSNSPDGRQHVENNFEMMTKCVEDNVENSGEEEMLTATTLVSTSLDEVSSRTLEEATKTTLTRQTVDEKEVEEIEPRPLTWAQKLGGLRKSVTPTAAKREQPVVSVLPSPTRRRRNATRPTASTRPLGGGRK
ncbi:unnamed protein product [Amoebophrya sp. A25]|nr:unnamed protein product [Amoebophrya sp. A25]|eukprot:GSA25T00012700001.1